MNEWAKDASLLVFKEVCEMSNELQEKKKKKKKHCLEANKFIFPVPMKRYSPERNVCDKVRDVL